VLEATVVDELQELLGDQFVTLLATFREDSSSLVEKIGAAMTVSDLEDLRHQAHSLNGSSSNLGALQISAVCKRIENFAATSAGEESTNIMLAEAQLKAMYAELVESHVQVVNDIDARLAHGENGL